MFGWLKKDKNQFEEYNHDYYGKALQDLHIRLKRYEPNAKIKLPSWLQHKVYKYFNFGELVGLDHQEMKEIEEPKNAYDLPKERSN